jgi:hypothetical protein
MYRSTRSMTLAAALLAPLPWLRAETVADPTGHWQGSIHAALQDFAVELDLAYSEDGKLIGTFSNPGQQINGFPFASATVSGNAVKLEIKIGADTQAFAGTVGADGRTMSGDFLVSVYGVPFELERTGPAKIDPPPRSPAIDPSLAGEWIASLDVGGQFLPVSLTLSNHSDGTSRGSWASGSGTPTAVKIVNEGRSVSLTSAIVPAAYRGIINAEGTEIAGTFTQSSAEQPMTFRRALAKR